MGAGPPFCCCLKLSLVRGVFTLILIMAIINDKLQCARPLPGLCWVPRGKPRGMGGGTNPESRGAPSTAFISSSEPNTTGRSGDSLVKSQWLKIRIWTSLVGKRTAKEHTASLPPSFTGGFHKHYLPTLARPPLSDLSAPLGSMDPSRDFLVNGVCGCGPLTPANYLCVLGQITFSLSALISSSLQQGYSSPHPKGLGRSK